MSMFSKLFRGPRRAGAASRSEVVMGVVVTVESAVTAAGQKNFRPEDLDVAGDVHGVLSVVGEGRLKVERLMPIRAASPAVSAATTLVGSPLPSPGVTAFETKAQVVAPLAEGAGKSLSADLPQGRPLSVADFRLIRYLGGGGQGQVWLVEHTRSQRLYALKAANKRALGEAHYSSIFIEQDAMRMLSGNAFFNSLQGSFEDDEFFFVVMDYHPGGDLDTKIRKEPRAALDMRWVAAEILHAMEALHRRGIIHRDLKPQNVLFNARGEAVVADLGLARMFGRTTADQPWRRKNALWQLREDLPDFVAGTAPVNVTQAQCGTLHYMAPEVFAGREYSYEVDVWSFAVTVYEMLHGGKLPFGGDDGISKEEYVRRVMMEQVEVDDDVDPDASDLLHTMFAKDPLRRPTWEQIKEHPWFDPINWAELALRQPLPAPACPKGLEPAPGVGSVEFGEPYAPGTTEHPFFLWASPELTAAPPAAEPVLERKPSKWRRLPKAKKLQSLFARETTRASPRANIPSVPRKDPHAELAPRRAPRRSPTTRCTRSAATAAYTAVARARPAGTATPAGCAATTTAKFEAIAISNSDLSRVDGSPTHTLARHRGTRSTAPSSSSLPYLKDSGAMSRDAAILPSLSADCYSSRSAGEASEALAASHFVGTLSSTSLTGSGSSSSSGSGSGSGTGSGSGLNGKVPRTRWLGIVRRLDIWWSRRGAKEVRRVEGGRMDLLE
ncbi:kinase-like domain-containing protein [Trametes meyenii]|nr:kinase-like domain-containing protein [Trametes meyenii]